MPMRKRPWVRRTLDRRVAYCQGRDDLFGPLHLVRASDWRDYRFRTRGATAALRGYRLRNLLHIRPMKFGNRNAPRQASSQGQVPSR